MKCTLDLSCLGMIRWKFFEMYVDTAREENLASFDRFRMSLWSAYCILVHLPSLYRDWLEVSNNFIESLVLCQDDLV